MYVIVPCPFYTIWNEFPSQEFEKPATEPAVITREDDVVVKYRGLEYEAEDLKKIVLENAHKHHFKLNMDRLEDLPAEFIFNAFHNIRAGVVPPEGVMPYRRPVVNNALGNKFNNNLYCLAGYIVCAIIFRKIALDFDGATLSQYKYFANVYKKLERLCNYMTMVIFKEIHLYDENKTLLGAVKQTFEDGTVEGSVIRHLYVDKVWYENCGLTDEQIYNMYLERLNK